MTTTMSTQSTLPTIGTDQPITYGRGTIRISRRGTNQSILLTALSRPRVKNAFSFPTYLDLIDLLHQATHDDTVSAIVLTGTGSYFTSGADLKEAVFVPENHVPMMERPPGRFMMAVLRFPKVIAAAVNGPAVGIGVSLLLHCDLCYCAEGATFWAPFSRLALVPEFCSSRTFLQTMGLSKANQLLLMSEKIDAKTAVNWNVCSKIIPNCDSSTGNNPFTNASIGSIVCREIDDKLLSLPRGKETAKVFVSMMRGKRQSLLESICEEELRKLDERIEAGECLEAGMQLQFGKSKL